MVWFYVINDSISTHQAFCMSELKINSGAQNQTKSDGKQQTVNRLSETKTPAVQKVVKGDLALGFEQGYIKIYDLSHHFQNSRVDEVNIPFFTA